MSFRLPGTSTSPSTPNRKNTRSLFSQPSTTPAGAPPSYLADASHVSTTPAGPPPRSVYGSSFNAANNTFGRKGNTPGRRGFAVPSSSPPLEEDEDDEDAEGEDDDEMDGVRRSTRSQGMSPEKSAFMSSIMDSPRGLKRSRNGKVREQTQSDYPAIARGIASHAAPVKLEEPDDMVLRQEEIMSRLEPLARERAGERDAAICEGVAELTKSWRQHSDAETKEGRLGPASDDAFTRATYLSSLLLQLHHPYTPKTTQQSTRLQRPVNHAKRPPSGACTIPRALLDWLDTWHNPFPDDFDTIWRNEPSPAGHERFWDSVLFALTRGKFDRAIRLLNDAGWDNSVTAEEDFGEGHTGYTGRQLDHIEEVIERCTTLLQACPAFKYGEWDVKGADWTVFRQRVRQAIKDLEIFAGEDDEEATESEAPKRNMFQMSAGMGDSMNMSTASKKAESKVPWSIYENMKLVYGILLGGVDELLDASQDWLEASIYLTVWWDGEDEAPAGLGRSQNLRRSMHASQRTREADVAPGAAYRKRLGDAFAMVTEAGDDAVFTPDTLDPVQVGLACVMVDNVESVISILRAWSLPITTAVVEVAALAGWLPQARPRSKGLLAQGFSSEDLMVLSHGAGHQPRTGEIERDEVLSEYAGLLADKEVLRSNDGKLEQEGWELAVAVLGRLGDESAGQVRIGELLGLIELSDETRVDKVLDACRNLELVDQARGIAERYADHLAESTQAYGPALIYYARAHATAKLKSTLSLLISLSLLHSASSPARQDLDTQLSSLLSRERTALVNLARSDTEAASLLASHLSGYATIRRFYDLRDQDVAPTTSSNGAALLRPLERKREAAKALIAVTESAADCIRGGLYDPEVESVVPVDGVLALLGEALPLLGQPKRIFTKDQVYNLLRVVEDFATAPSRIRENAESLLQASINAYKDGGKIGMSELLKKSRSDLSSKSVRLGGSSYDMLASSAMLQSQEKKGGKGAEAKRGWDWRKGLDGVGTTVDVGGEDVLMLLRLALAQEVARGLSGQINW
ncbi:hypothetical protein LTR36_004710 [Oleoguttula mirabilis]|uniref:Nuclear pore complex protein Nup85 n=1 Tax=Oleoguttula mirabilis TaxID=1507867 RepID=A0AAV9JGK2_9PEZI|nr:hypothetical protein LTR36_004710 [Oleoguttula mirabilis]